MRDSIAPFSINSWAWCKAFQILAAIRLAAILLNCVVLLLLRAVFHNRGGWTGVDRPYLQQSSCINRVLVLHDTRSSQLATQDRPSSSSPSQDNLVRVKSCFCGFSLLPNSVHAVTAISLLLQEEGKAVADSKIVASKLRRCQLTKEVCSKYPTRGPNWADVN